jgi:cell division protein FtsI/penicillin-binding protein 2
LTALCVTRAAASDPVGLDRVPRERPSGAETTIDAELQDVARQLLAAARPIIGGIVAVHAPTGEIRALSEYHRAGEHRRPLTRAITPAASLFKLVTSTALYERAHVSPDMTVCISGGERGIERFHLTAPRGNLPRSCRPFEEALGFSRNAVFAQLATQHLLHRDLVEVAEQLGFNAALSFDTPAQMGTLSVPYNDLEFARTAAGFRGSRLSVLGAAQLAYLVASGGRAPRMTTARRDPLDVPAPDAGPRAMSRTTARRLRRMMEVTIHSGTCLEAFTSETGASYLGQIRAAGKTGTLRPNADGPTTSWFIGFAPSRSPELVIAVMLENSPVWRRKANYVARDMMRAYFHDRPGVTHPFAAPPATPESPAHPATPPVTASAAARGR